MIEDSAVRTADRVASPHGSPRLGQAIGILLRLTATAAFIAGIAQAMFAGKFLAGNYDALALHESNAVVLSILTVGLLVLILLRRWLSSGPNWPIAVAILTFFAEGAQAATAEKNLLELHVPLGVATIAALGALAIQAWQTRPAQVPEVGR